MDSLLIGTGGVSGWPDEGCRCASCMRARSSGLYRAPGRVLVDGILEIVPGRRSWPETWPSASPAHRIEQLPGGWDITGPDGGRLLLSAGPGQVPEPPRGCGQPARKSLGTSPAPDDSAPRSCRYWGRGLT